MILCKRLILWVLVLLVLPVGAIWVMVAQPTLLRAARSKASVDPQALQRHVAAFSKDFIPRTFVDTTNMARCVEYIEERFRKAGAVVSNQTYIAYKTPCRNVIALFPGEDQRRVVVGAHYDAVPMTPGADDNASGVAGLLELAQLLKGVKPKHTVELVAYCTEEPPCFESEHMGSAHHALSLFRTRTSVIAMLAVEMINTFFDEPGSQRYPMPLLRLFYPDKGHFVAVVGNFRQRELIGKVKRHMRGAADIPVHSICAPTFFSGVDLSDHRNYWALGYPAVMITDTAFYRNRVYHQAEDTADRLDYGRMARTVACLYETVLNLANE